MDEQDEPRHFHLLSEREIRSLRPVLEIIGKHRGPILERWFELYDEHFGDARSLAKPEFQEIYGRDLDAMVQNLLDADMEGFATEIRALGRELAERGVPFAEVVASVHFLEESAAAHFRLRAPAAPAAD